MCAPVCRYIHLSQYQKYSHNTLKSYIRIAPGTEVWWYVTGTRQCMPATLGFYPISWNLAEFVCVQKQIHIRAAKVGANYLRPT